LKIYQGLKTKGARGSDRKKKTVTLARQIVHQTGHEEKNAKFIIKANTKEIKLNHNNGGGLT